jgi:hypothetical protein
VAGEMLHEAKGSKCLPAIRQGGTQAEGQVPKHSRGGTRTRDHGIMSSDGPPEKPDLPSDNAP